MCRYLWVAVSLGIDSLKARSRVGVTVVPAAGSRVTASGSQYRFPGAFGRLISGLVAKTAWTAYSPAGRSLSDEGNTSDAASSVTVLSAVNPSASAPRTGSTGGR